MPYVEFILRDRPYSTNKLRLDERVVVVVCGGEGGRGGGVLSQSFATTQHINSVQSNRKVLLGK